MAKKPVKISLQSIRNNPNATHGLKRVLAARGTDKDRDILIYDRNPTVRSAVAEYGNDKHRDALVNDPKVPVRVAVAQHGTDEHRLKLLDDFKNHSGYVGRAIAHHTNSEQVLDKMHLTGPFDHWTSSVLNAKRIRMGLPKMSFISMDFKPVNALKRIGHPRHDQAFLDNMRDEMRAKVFHEARTADPQTPYHINGLLRHGNLDDLNKLSKHPDPFVQRLAKNAKARLRKHES